jgi:hypothetical protein
MTVPDDEAALEDLIHRVSGLLARVDGLEAVNKDYAFPLLARAEEHLEEDRPPRPPERTAGATPTSAMASGSPAGAGADAEAPEPAFANAVAWVEGWFLPTIQRQAGGGESRWCARWWAHAEAMTRFEALWRSWEVLRLDAGTGLSLWLRDHLDPQLTRLMSADGPFAQCAPDRHEPLPRLASQVAPGVGAVTSADAVSDASVASARNRLPGGSVDGPEGRETETGVLPCLTGRTP